MVLLRRSLIIITMFFVMVFALSVAAYADTPSVNSSNVTLYAMSDAYEGTNVPDVPESGKSFQLKVTGATIKSCYVRTGDSVTVTSSGLIKPAVTIWYWKNGYGTTFKPSDLTGYTIEKSINPGVSEIVVETTGGNITVKAEVVDYAKYYADGLIDQVLAGIITDGMTNEEKIKAVTKYVAENTDYSVSYQSYVDMMIFESGDCWASANTISEMCRRIGFDAWTRNANKDSGAGSGHENAIISADGRYYIAEAGFSGTRPRYWFVTTRSTLFSMDETVSTYNGGQTLAQYDGIDKEHTSLTIPAEADGEKITVIGEKFGLRSPEQNSWKEINIEEGIEKLESSAFNSSYYLEKITIPSTVTAIGNFALTNCPKLKDISIADGNTAYCAEGGAIYSKDKKTLYICPGQDTLTVPEQVETISDYAFYYNRNIKQLILPASVKSIGLGAFGDSGITKLVFTGDMPEFEDYAFSGLYLKVYYPEGNSTWATSEEYKASSIEWIPCNVKKEHHERQASTCTESGTIEYWTMFGSYYSDEACTEEISAKDIVLPAKGHSYIETEREEASCEEAGHTAYRCENCGDTYEETIPATGHKFSAWEIVEEPTETEEGLKQRTCEVCGKVETATLPTIKPNTMKVNALSVTVKYSRLKKKTQYVAAKKVFAVKNAQGKVTYKVAKYDKKAKKKITVSSSGKMTVKKGLKKGTYRVKVKVTAKGTAEYLPLTKTVTVKVRVK